MDAIIKSILKEDSRRVEEMFKFFDPITGEGSILSRFRAEIKDFPIPVQYLPVGMQDVPLVEGLLKAGSVEDYIGELGEEYDDIKYNMVVEEFTRIRYRYDFCFWAACLVYIKRKGGGTDILFKLNRPQRRLITRFEECRIKDLPIREIILKARQWGGSTATQMYFAWLQLIHKVGLNSLIIAHVKDTSIEILDMFDRMLKEYPTEMLHELCEIYSLNESKWETVFGAPNIHRVPQRNCKIKIGTAEKPDSCRGGDYNLVHCSEVGLWKKTEGKSPEDIVRSAISGILLEPYTAVVYESTANGTGNFFQLEYDAAKAGKSKFKALFVSWFEIEKYRAQFESEKEREEFAAWLYENRENRNVMSDREEPGTYLWWLWTIGADLAAIKWYIEERSTRADHGTMASEYPSDDVEAFVHSGARVFDKEKVDAFKDACKRPPRYIGEIVAHKDDGPEALENLRFEEDHCGELWIWNKPETFDDVEITDRYLVVVDIGGRSNKADWSVIVVFDRIYMMDGDKPAVVAQWYGHIDMDILAWKAAQIARYYCNAKLVIESNTLETHDKERDIEGDQSAFILNQIKDVYDNLYARKQSEDDIREGKPKKYGFHTNTSTKPMVISTLIKVVRNHMYVERDERCLNEYITYEKKQNGAYGAIPGKHDDLLMTRAIGLHICFYEMDLPVERKINVDYNTYGTRHEITEATI